LDEENPPMVDIEQILNAPRNYQPIAEEIPQGRQTLRGVEIAASNHLYGGGECNDMISRLVEIIKVLGAQLGHEAREIQ
jgi:hypothetical protein